jgi:hypothetical protein
MLIAALTRQHRCVTYNSLNIISFKKTVQVQHFSLANESAFHPSKKFQNKVAVYALAERADTLLLFHLYPYMYSVGFPV